MVIASARGGSGADGGGDWLREAKATEVGSVHLALTTFIASQPGSLIIPDSSRYLGFVSQKLAEDLGTLQVAELSSP